MNIAREQAITKSTNNAWTGGFPTDASKTHLTEIIKVEVVAERVLLPAMGNMVSGFLFCCAKCKQKHKQIPPDAKAFLETKLKMY